MNLKEHLRVTKDFLGIEGNPEVHHLLDIGLGKKYQPQFHKLTHNPQFINTFINSAFGEKGVLEAWLHLLVDFGFFNDYYSKEPAKEKTTEKKPSSRTKRVKKESEKAAVQTSLDFDVVTESIAKKRGRPKKST